ncbi:hypothetical protein ACYX79_02560 [Stenotrophomonas rhizophila]
MKNRSTLSLTFALIATLSSAAHAAESTSTTEPHVDIGGAVRFNYGWLDYGPTSRLQLELLRADIDAGAGPLFLSAQYRWYDGFDAVHHAYLGWNASEDTVVQAGIQQVPFGLLPFAAQSFWFGSGYYLGIEDDYDPGMVIRHRDGADQWHLGWFAGDEYGTGARSDRYSFDVAQTDTLPYRERERLHLRYEHSQAWAGGDLLLGGSAFSGRVENVRTGQRYGHHAAAVHAQWTRDSWTTQLQWARYRYSIPSERIAMSAFLAPFEIAAEADVPTANVAYSFGKTRWLDNVTCYNNLSMTLPVQDAPQLRNSWQNVTGCSVQKGAMLTYADWIAGKNMWFAGGNGVGIDDGAATGWHSRFNLNIGFYF